MTNEKAIGPGYEDLHNRLDEMVAVLTSDFKCGKTLHWPLLSKDRIHSTWSDFVKHGSVRDERALDAIFACIRDNVLRLEVCTIVAEHTGLCRDSFLEDYLDPHSFEPFTAWLVDFDGDGRLSDYGLGPLQDAVALAFEARTPEAKLKYLDRALNVTHSRGDLSRLFVEGGRTTVLGLVELNENVDIPTRHRRKP